MKERAPVVAGAGICCIDYLVVAPKVNWGDTVHISNYIAQGGGLVGTAIVACARLGANCDLISILGDDKIGDEIVEELVNEGISSDGILRIKNGMSPFSFIHVDETNGERTIFHRPGKGLNLSSDQFEFPNAANWDALLVDHVYMDLSLAAAKAANDNNVPVVADLIPDEENQELLKYVDILIAPKHFARDMGCENNLYRALDAIHNLGPTTAVITLGEQGWISSDHKGCCRGEAFKVGVVDTTGAGDSFHGGFTYGVAMGWDTAKCARFASAVAAIKCTQPGGRTGLPNFEQVIKFMNEY